MSYRLAVAEKPSVAQSIANVLGATRRRSGYLDGNGWLVSWCVGHLVELAEPESYDERYRKWRYEDLPIVPGKWQGLIRGLTEMKEELQPDEEPLLSMTQTLLGKLSSMTEQQFWDLTEGRYPVILSRHVLLRWHYDWNEE